MSGSSPAAASCLPLLSFIQTKTHARTHTHTDTGTISFLSAAVSLLIYRSMLYLSLNGWFIFVTDKCWTVNRNGFCR
uniref:Uncharacterized protein n=1 Tax=Anopheles darlingi TaxID=43151 RepID=A0A2M4D2B3_ANODA